MGCVDYTEVFFIKDGKLHCYSKVSIVKMVDSSSESDLENYKKQLPSSAVLSAFSNDDYTGYEARFDSALQISGEMQNYMPKKSNNLIYIPIFLVQDIAKQLSSSSEKDEFGMDKMSSEMLLPSCKCRVQVSKDILKTIKRAYFKGGDNKNLTLNYYDYGDSWTFEIPFSVFVENKIDTTKIIVESSL